MAQQDLEFINSSLCTAHNFGLKPTFIDFQLHCTSHVGKHVLPPNSHRRKYPITTCTFLPARPGLLFRSGN